MSSPHLKKLNIAHLPAIWGIIQHYPMLNWSESKLITSLTQPHNISFGLLQDNQLISIALFSTVLDEAELLVLATHPDHRQQGYATELLQACLQQLKKAAIVFLEVRQHNHTALQLYTKLGFSQAGLRKQYYQCPTEDAIILSRQK